MLRLGWLVAIACGGCGFQIAGAPGDAGDDGGTGPVTVEFAAGGQSLAEAATTVMAEVRLSRPSTSQVMVAFSVAGSASTPEDYSVTTASPLVFPPGEMTRSIELAIVADANVEPTEALTLTLTSATFAALGAAKTHTVTILDGGAVCYGTGAYAVCLGAPPAGTTVLPQNLNTDPGSPDCAPTQPATWVMAQGQPAACFVLGETIMASDTTVTGSRPLVLVASNAITIGGLLDASSRRMPARTGPGAPYGMCPDYTELAEDSSGGGGGAGGSFLSRGGSGGNGKGSNGGNAFSAVAAPSVLRAGCNGQRGGDGDVAAGPPGRSGGVVYLVAGGTITIGTSGIVNASGSGGSSAGDSTGGSGGGAGGMIKLHAATIDLAGQLVANGGGGASGADDNGGANPGADPDPGDPDEPALGGIGPTQSGGDGFAGATQARNGGNAPGSSANAGGGGGGGGGGLIEANHPLPATRVSAGLVREL